MAYLDLLLDAPSVGALSEEAARIVRVEIGVDENEVAR